MKKNIIILTLILIFPTLLSAQQLTLDECIRIALENNRNIKQQKLSHQSRTIAYDQARADLLPGVNSSLGQNFNFGRSIGVDNTYKDANSSQTSFNLSGDVTLFDGLRMKHNIDARKADMLASEADIKTVEKEITMSVTTAYLQVLLNKELTKISQDQLQLTKVDLERRQQLVNSGKIAKGELYQLEAQQAKEEMNLVQNQNNTKLALLDLAQIMELEDFKNLDVVNPNYDSLLTQQPLTAQSVYESAVMNRPEITASQYRLQSSEKEVLMAKSGLYPTIGLGAGLGTGYYHMQNMPNRSFNEQFKNNMSSYIGFNITYPIFNKFRTRNAIKNAQISVENSKLEMDKVKIDLRKKIEQAYQSAISAESRWKAAQKSEIASREAYRFAEQKYETGRGNSFEVSQAKTNLAQVLGEQTQAKYEYAFRLKMLELLKN